MVSVIDTVEDNTMSIPIKERLGIEKLAAVIIKFDSMELMSIMIW